MPTRAWTPQDAITTAVKYQQELAGRVLGNMASLLPWQAGTMTDGKPEPTPAERVTAAMDEFMATVLRHLPTGQGSPLDELGLQKSKEELQHWQPDVSGAGAEPGRT
jgi:hypothetical protein